MARFIAKIGTEIPSVCSEWDFLLTISERLVLLEIFEAENRCVAETYLGHSRDMLFQDQIQCDSHGLSDYPGLSMEQALEIAMRLYCIQQSIEVRRL